MTVFYVSDVYAGTWFVAPNGADTNLGTIEEPFATLQKAVDLVDSGDIIYLRGGTYQITKSIRLTAKSGDREHPFKLFNYPNESPILDAGAMNEKDTWVISIGPVGDWWHIKGLEIKNNRYGGGIVVHSSNNIIEGNDVHHNGMLSEWAATGIMMFMGSNNLIVNNDSHHNQDADYGDADGIGSQSGGTGNVIRGNRVWRNSDDGIDLWDGAPTIIEGNWSWENGYDDNLRPLGNGMGFKLGGQHPGSSSGGHTVRNNIAWKNQMDGFAENGAKKGLLLYNNTAWNNKRYQFVMSNKIPNVLRNNLSFGGKGNLFEVAGDDSYNSWSIPVTVNNDDFESIDFGGLLKARKKGICESRGITSNFLKLRTGSDLKGKGVNVDGSSGENNPDLGVNFDAKSH